MGRQLSRGFLDVVAIIGCTKTPGGAVSLRIKPGNTGYSVVSLTGAIRFGLVKGSH